MTFRGTLDDSAVDLHPHSGGRIQIHDLHQCCGLSGPGLADDGEALGLAHVEAHAVDGPHRTQAALEHRATQLEGACEVLDAEHHGAIRTGLHLELRLRHGGHTVDLLRICVDRLSGSDTGDSMGTVVWDRE